MNDEMDKVMFSLVHAEGTLMAKFDLQAMPEDR